MFVSILRSNRRLFSHGVAVLILGGVTAGCSSQVARFNGPDDVFTGSTSNQRQIINGDQAYPGDTSPQQSSATQTVSRSSLAPVKAEPLPPPSYPTSPASAPVVARPAPMAPQASAPVAAPAPVKTASIVTMPSAPKSSTPASPAGELKVPSARPQPQTVDAKATGSVQSVPAQGTTIVVGNGQTLLGIAHKYDVSAEAILKANGMTDPSGLKYGQKIIIPGAAQKAERLPEPAKVSAPVPKMAEVKPAAQPVVKTSASAPKVAEAKPSAPAKAPSASEQKVAALPQPTKIKEPVAESAAGSAAAKPKAIVSAEVAPAGGYTVKAGDTLAKIAKRTGTSVAALKSANGDGQLKIGQAIKVPPASASSLDPVKTAATPPAPKKVAETAVTEYTPPKKDDKVIEQAEASPDKAPDSTGIDRMRWPVKGRVITAFGKGSGKANDGIDIAVPEGTAVKAAENGVVIYAGDGLKEFGNTVLVRHDDGLVTVYGNAKELKVQRGQKVKRGDDIALSGMSGDATTPKLHFEVRKNSAPVDPSTFLE